MFSLFKMQVLPPNVPSNLTDRWLHPQPGFFSAPRTWSSGDQEARGERGASPVAAFIFRRPHLLPRTQRVIYPGPTWSDPVWSDQGRPSLSSGGGVAGCIVINVREVLRGRNNKPRPAGGPGETRMNIGNLLRPLRQLGPVKTKNDTNTTRDQ